MLRKLRLLLYNLTFSKFFLRRNVQERLARHMFFYNAFYALSFNGIDGDYVEFGSWGGLTFSLAYRESRRWGHKAKLWAFDSFQGLPPPAHVMDEHPQWKQGDMATSVDEFHSICASNGIPRDAYETVVGFYDQTLPNRGPDEKPDNIAMAYVDCDLYSSTRTVLEFLMPRLKHGMILAFDDYFCWSATQISGERKAFLELLADHPRWHFLPYQTIGMGGMSFVVEDRKLLS